ncbi:phosphoribosylglycinamide synthetase [Erythrobacter litoralis]|uniref:phosphoribosylglycinamide synthetase n=1 Tax=Erythrobacter litoralis TaxID=39960 RepID=UPI0024348E18|nr:phosphoribosylglycinamide synthetase [Erythrobacter litoralis]
METVDRYEALYNPNGFDFVVTLLNRGGFQNSEMLGPLLATKNGLPYLGATPILRGLADDKHLCRQLARLHNIPIAQGGIVRQGGISTIEPFEADLYVVKPNASSASWGIQFCETWAQAQMQIGRLHWEGHDAVIEEWLPLYDVAVPVIGGRNGMPQLLPPMLFNNGDPLSFRSYEEKRGLIPQDVSDDLIEIDDVALSSRFHAMVTRLLPEFWPFDYGRLEFRYDPRTGTIHFMEINVSCNLWSRKSVSRAAALCGLDHPALVETVLAHSLQRQGLIESDHRVAVA